MHRILHLLGLNATTTSRIKSAEWQVIALGSKLWSCHSMYSRYELRLFGENCLMEIMNVKIPGLLGNRYPAIQLGTHLGHSNSKQSSRLSNRPSRAYNWMSDRSNYIYSVIPPSQTEASSALIINYCLQLRELPVIPQSPASHMESRAVHYTIPRQASLPPEIDSYFR